MLLAKAVLISVVMGWVTASKWRTEQLSSLHLPTRSRNPQKMQMPSRRSLWTGQKGLTRFLGLPSRWLSSFSTSFTGSHTRSFGMKMSTRNRCALQILGPSCLSVVLVNTQCNCLYITLTEAKIGGGGGRILGWVSWHLCEQSYTAMKENVRTKLSCCRIMWV